MIVTAAISGKVSHKCHTSVTQVSQKGHTMAYMTFEKIENRDDEL